MVQVILKEHIDKLGEAGDVVDVRPGYARNFLLPQELAMLATTPNLLILKDQRAEMKKAADNKRQESEQIKGKIESLGVIRVQASVGPTGKLFGRVTVSDLVPHIQELSPQKIERKHVQITGHSHGVDELGAYQVRIDLGSAVYASLQLEVIEE